MYYYFLVRRKTTLNIDFTTVFIGLIQLVENDHAIDIFTSEDMENVLQCISQYLTSCLLYITNIYTYGIILDIWHLGINYIAHTKYGICNN